MPIGISVYATVDLSQAKYSNHDRKTGVSPITILTSTSSCLKFTKKHVSSPGTIRVNRPSVLTFA